MTYQNIVPTADQAAAIAKAQEFLDDQDRKSMVLNGCAGSGKTTTLRMIRDMLPGQCIITAPTNKAVGVLRGKGFDRATTLDRVLHKSMYTPSWRLPTQEEITFHQENNLPVPEKIEVEAYEKVEADAGGTCVCVDESSMTNEYEFTRLIGMYPKVIFCGDGFQLPPVDGDAWFQTVEPDATLNEVTRTAAQSEITQVAMLIRARSPEWKKRSWSAEVTIISRTDRHAVNHALIGADIVLACKNSTCDDYNFRIRDLRGLLNDGDPFIPAAGDMLLSWITDKDKRITKSELYEVRKSFPLNGGYRVNFNRSKDDYIDISKASLREQKTDITLQGLKKFSFGHCITVHKSQGSEWDNVVVLANDHWDRFPDHWNWLYTAVTRAKKHLTIVI